jgi:two-component system sensor histidine kinase DesK
MAVVAALPLRGAHRLRWADSVDRSQVVIAVPASESSTVVVRFATAGALAYCSVFPIIQVGLVAESPRGGYERAAWALAAMVCYLPIHLRHIHYAIRGIRPPAGAWSLAVMGIVIAAALPVSRDIWLPSFHAVAVSGLIVLRPRWSLPLFGALVIAQAPLAIALHSPIPSPASYYILTLLWRTAAVFVPIWLIGVVRQLEAARHALAEDAVVRERLRADSELRHTLGTAMATIARRGESAAVLAEADQPAAAAELTLLVDDSRRTLAVARELISSYHRSTLWAELEVAAGLLVAAGIHTRLVLPSGDPPRELPAEFRSELRSTTAQLLRDESARACVITVSRFQTGVHLDITVDDRQIASMAVSA